MSANYIRNLAVIVKQPLHLIKYEVGIAGAKEAVRYQWEPKFNQRVSTHKKGLQVSLKQESVTYK